MQTPPITQPFQPTIPVPDPNPSPTLTDFPLLHYLRIIFYVFIVIKLVEIVFMRRRKLKISERIQRKFLFAHGMDMIRNFSAEEHQLMNLTLQNTLKNAIQPLGNNTKKGSIKARKSVSFLVESNVYYDPPEMKSNTSSSYSQISTVNISKSNQVADASDAQQKKFEEESVPLIVNEQANKSSAVEQPNPVS